uniref:Dynein light chain n=1 Tax=Anas zonorhyncha TaxID=75864 RepID=A0A8B9ZWK4_9AVES
MLWLTRLEKKNSNLAEVEVDEVLGLMSHVAAEVPSHDAVPSGIVFLRLRGTLYRVLLHLLRHVRVLDHRLSLAHGCLRGAKPGPQDVWGDPQCSVLLVSLSLGHFLLILSAAATKLLLSVAQLVIC